LKFDENERDDIVNFARTSRRYRRFPLRAPSVAASSLLPRQFQLQGSHSHSRLLYLCLHLTHGLSSDTFIAYVAGLPSRTRDPARSRREEGRGRPKGEKSARSRIGGFAGIASRLLLTPPSLSPSWKLELPLARRRRTLKYEEVLAALGFPLEAE
jgi:hypothetical protein